jgi:hypothetical protein
MNAKTSKMKLLIVAGFAIAGVATGAAAQQHMMDHAAHMAAPADAREMVQFPQEMQVNFLGNMRDHMQTIDAVVQALAASDYVNASKVAAERLGLDSPSAAGCKPKPPGVSEKSKAEMTPGKPMTMEEMMDLYMPDAMRSVGLSMHTAASEFSKIALTKDRDASMKALAQVTQACVACHSAYRLR